jgi:hypothetical protein
MRLLNVYSTVYSVRSCSALVSVAVTVHEAAYRLGSDRGSHPCRGHS